MREFFLALVLALGFTYLSQRFAPFLGLLDQPDDGHKQHGRAVFIGGWAIVIAMAPIFFFTGIEKLWAFGFGSLIAFGTGLLDDRFGLGPRAKLLGQSLAALAAVLLASWSVQSVNFLNVQLVLGWFAIPFTLFWIVGAINAFNLIDGLDGLASGGALVIFGAMALIAGQGGNGAVFTFSLGFVGALLGFLFFNWAPARVFLGDGGTHFVGYWLAILAIQATQPGLAISLDNVPILVPIFLLGVPILDTAWAILRRLFNRKPIFQADRGHLHHRVLALGWGERVTAVLLYGVFVFVCGLAVAIDYFF